MQGDKLLNELEAEANRIAVYGEWDEIIYFGAFEYKQSKLEILKKYFGMTEDEAYAHI